MARALVGTEGTCVIVLEAKLKLIHNPRHKVLVGLGYKDAFFAADHVPEILEFEPIGFEGFEGTITEGLRRKGTPNVDLLPEGGGVLLVEFGSDDAEQAQDRALQAHEPAEAGVRSTHHAALHQKRSAHRLESSRKRTARGRLCSGCAAPVGRLG